MYSSPRAPQFETDMSIDDDGHTSDTDPVSSVQSEESTLAPLSPHGMIIIIMNTCQGLT